MRLALLVAGMILRVRSAEAAAPDDLPLLPPTIERPLLLGPVLGRFDFEQGNDGFRAGHATRVEAKEGALVVECTDDDPWLLSPPLALASPLAIRLVARSNGAGRAQWFWTTREDPNWSEQQSLHFELPQDGRTHEILSRIPVTGTLTALRLDPGVGRGSCAIEALELLHAELHPLVFEKLERNGSHLDVVVKNAGATALEVSVGATTQRIEAGASGSFAPELAELVKLKELTELSRRELRRFDAVDVVASAPGLPPRSAHLRLITPELPTPFHTLALPGKESLLRLEVDDAGAGALVSFLDRPVAAICAAPPPARTEFTLQQSEIVIRVSSEGPDPVEAPVVHVFGKLDQAVFCGLEFLDGPDTSSSDADIETEERFRYVPDPRLVTWPLMAVATERATVALAWDDTKLQPVFASPDRFDGTHDHRMALRRRGDFEARMIVGPPGAMHKVILWGALRRDLLEDGSPLPVLRPRDEQWRLCQAALAGPLRGEGGWGHCAEPTWPRQPFASFAGTLFRMTGELPELASLADGGSHLANDAAWFLTGRAREWLERRTSEAEELCRTQGDDGLWRYDGPFRRGHFEDTASGWCAPKAVALLDFARLTGNEPARAAGLEAVTAMHRFNVPRGAQTWELSLHTPDLLAAAWHTEAAVLALELSGDRGFGFDAQRAALSGLPFVYLRDELPIEAFATVPVFGATNWRAPNWIGLPVQWCGVVYAHAVARLARHDRLALWPRLARGILATAEAMQHPDGPLLGCLPDAFELSSQSRLPASINPCALVSLRMELEGEEPGLSVASDATHHVVAPFPVELAGSVARIRAPVGRRYQVLIDGTRIVDVVGTGADRIDLADAAGAGR